MAKQEDQPEVFEIRKAVRHATPQMMAISGPAFSGKTFGAIMLASGLVEPGGKIGVIDTENGRFSQYADDPDVIRAVPQGFELIELHPPFHPKRYIAANQALERAGCSLIITDSGSHGWDGLGGAQDMKEEDKGWKNAKLWTRRWSAAMSYSDAHQIVCLRAQEKTKIVGTGRAQEYVPLGMAAIAEKNFLFNLGLYFLVEGEIDNKPATHLAKPVKWPKAMNGLMGSWVPQLLTPDVGRKIREWNNSGVKESPIARLLKRASLVALDGESAYMAFFESLNDKLKKVLVEQTHAGNLEIARNADAQSDDYPEISWPEIVSSFATPEDAYSALEKAGYQAWSDVRRADQQSVANRMSEAKAA